MDIKQIIDMYQGGQTLSEIGLFYGVDRNTIRYHLKRNGVKLRTRKEVMSKFKRTDITVESILFLINVCGLLENDVADYYSVSRNTIYKKLKEAGINMKNHEGQRAKQSNFMKNNNPVKKR